MPSKKKSEAAAEMPSLKAIATTAAKTAANFEELLSAATALAMHDYPRAAFYEVDGPCPDGATRFADIPSWRFVYTDMQGGTVFVTAKNGVITGESHVNQPWMEDRVISGAQPVTFDMAIGILRHAGHTTPFTYANMRFPLYPGVVEPAYIFQFGRNNFVSVGSRTGTVHQMMATDVVQVRPTRPTGQMPAKAGKKAAAKAAPKTKAKAA